MVANAGADLEHGLVRQRQTQRRQVLLASLGVAEVVVRPKDVSGIHADRLPDSCGSAGHRMIICRQVLAEPVNGGAQAILE